MRRKRPEILDNSAVPAERVQSCLARIELALARGNPDECYAAIEWAFDFDKPALITLDSSVCELLANPRIVNALENRSIFTVRELCEWSYTGLRDLPYMGSGYVREIVKALEKHGLSLRDFSKFNDRV